MANNAKSREPTRLTVRLNW